MRQTRRTAGAANAMRRRLIDYDPWTKTQTWHEYDPLTDTTTIGEIQDCQQVIETNKATQNIGTPGGRLNAYEQAGIKNSWAHAATIPNSVINKWRIEEGIDVFNKNHIDAVTKKLNDPEWRFLRTGNMRV